MLAVAHQNTDLFGLSADGSPGSGLGKFWAIASTASAALSGYHGYRRNESIGWGIWWFVAGGTLPVLVPVLAVAQGFGKRK